jgi:hypothetical protein
VALRDVVRVERPASADSRPVRAGSGHGIAS